MKCCLSTGVGTWTNWLTFERDPDHNPDAGTRLLSLISYNAATRNFTSGKSHLRRAARASCGFKIVLFTDRRKTFVGGTCALPSALLVSGTPVTSTWPHLRCDVGLEEGEYWKKNCLYVTVLCTIIMVHKGMSSSYSLTGRSTVSYRALILLGLALYLPSASVSLVFTLHGAMYITFFAYILLFTF